MVIREAPWQVVVFSLGMYLVVYGLRNEGLTDHLATLLDLFAGYGVWGATFGTGLLIAFLSSIMNNMPTVLVGALSIDASQAEGIVREAMIHAHVTGSDTGPKFTPIGSLAHLPLRDCGGQQCLREPWALHFTGGGVLAN